MKQNVSWEELLDFLNFLSETKRFHQTTTSPSFFVKNGASFVYRLMQHLSKDNVSSKLECAELQEHFSILNPKLVKALMLDVSSTYFVASFSDIIQKILSNPKIQSFIDNTNYLPKCELEGFSYKHLHHSICEGIFSNILSSTDYHNYFWVRLDHDDSFELSETNYDNEGENYVRLSVLSHSALAYDSSIFNLLDEPNTQVIETVKKVYRPYYLEYYIDTGNLDNIQKEFLLNTENHERWFNAYFASSQDDITNNYGRIQFSGVFAYSASPVKYANRKLIIEDSRVDSEILNMISQAYTLSGTYCAKQSVIQTELQSIFNNVTFNKTRIYKVGNGNCVYSYGRAGKTEKRLLYDIGFDNNTAIREHIANTSFSYKDSLTRIRQFIPSCVILSHWDADHYKACAYARKEIFDCKWIAPDIKDANSNGKRLGIYLYKIGNMMFVDRDDANKKLEVQLAKHSKLVLYLGKKSPDLSVINCEGIAIMHENQVGKNQKIRCLMQGDVPYISLPAEAHFATENPYDYLIVPHHGSKMDYSLLASASTVDGKAVICCNNNTTKVKYRPATEHLDALNRCYGEVEVTENAPNFIQFNLRKKNSMIRG